MCAHKVEGMDGQREINGITDPVRSRMRKRVKNKHLHCALARRGCGQ